MTAQITTDPEDQRGHQNASDPVTVTMSLDFDQLATIIVEKNYGSIRFLHALLRAIRRSPKQTQRVVRIGDLLAQLLSDPKIV